MRNTSRSIVGRLAEIGLITVPLAAALLITSLVRMAVPDVALVTHLLSVPAPSASALSTVFSQAGYAWPPGSSIPALVPDRLPPDLDAIPSMRRKRLFFRSLLPAVIAENNRILQQRRFLEHYFQTGVSSHPDAARARLDRIARRYKVEGEPDDPVFQQRLLSRVDTVPFALVLAQGAKESGWGTSRFARQANSLFGIWTYKAEAGVIPDRRAEDADNYVRRFPDITAAVRSYLYNINVGHAYTKLRRMRAVMRAAGLDRLDPAILAGGLESYSEMGATYVAHIRSLMRQNHLDRMPRPRLSLPGDSVTSRVDEPRVTVPVVAPRKR